MRCFIGTHERPTLSRMEKEEERNGGGNQSGGEDRGGGAERGGCGGDCGQNGK